MSDLNYDTLMTDLSAPFELWEHEYRKQGRGDDVMMYLTYVGIEHVIARFNKVLGRHWSWTVLDLRLVGTTEKPAVIVHGRISFTDEAGREIHRDGLGAAQWQSTADDLDKIVKSGMAEAFKKASHQFGMAGYLWDKGLADHVTLELLKEEGRPWMARSRPKTPRAGNIAASILRTVRDSQATVRAESAKPKKTVRPEQAPSPAPGSSPGPTAAAAPAEPYGSDPAWLEAFETLKAYVKSASPEGGPAQWTETISNLVDGRFRTRSPRAVSAEELAHFAQELQQASSPGDGTASAAKGRSRAAKAGSAS